MKSFGLNLLYQLTCLLNLCPAQRILIKILSKCTVEGHTLYQLSKGIGRVKGSYKKLEEKNKAQYLETVKIQIVFLGVLIVKNPNTREIFNVCK